MKYLFVGLFLSVWGAAGSMAPSALAEEGPKIDVLNIQEVPAGIYEVEFDEGEGKRATVRVSVKGNAATFLKSSLPKFNGLSGTFELIGNGVFLAKLKCAAGYTSQMWIFRPDGSAVVKEIPDRGEEQTARPVTRVNAKI